MRIRRSAASLIRTWALAAAAVTVLASPAPVRAQADVPAPGSGCVEVIPAQAGASPAILLDKCTGHTWQLVRSYTGRHGARYAWHPLLRQDTAKPVPRATSAAATAPSAPRAPSSSKCFSFNGRTFCE